jgi:hypothetical protein
MALSAMKDDRFHCTGKHEKFIGQTVSSTNKADCHDITKILLKVALNTINLSLTINYASIKQQKWQQRCIEYTSP